MSTYKIDPKKDVLQMSEEEFRQGVLKLQQLLGELNYVRHKCRYDIEFAVKKVARLVNYPHERVFYMIYKIIQYLVRYKDIGIHYDRDCNKDKKVIAITDASVGSEYDAQSRIGVILWYGMNILMFILTRAQTDVYHQQKQSFMPFMKAMQTQKR